jgi:hypothetical protein
MADWSSAELDAIEDLLEGLDSMDDLAISAASPSMQGYRALKDYQGILQASREALPLEEPSEAMLAAIRREAASPSSSLAQAESVPAPLVTPMETDPPKRRRRWWLPLLSLCGSAALVLWMVVPENRASLDLNAPASKSAEDAAQAYPAAASERKVEAVAPASPPAQLTPPGERVNNQEGAAEAAQAVDDEAVAPAKEEKAMLDADALKTGRGGGDQNEASGGAAKSAEFDDSAMVGKNSQGVAAKPKSKRSATPSASKKGSSGIDSAAGNGDVLADPRQDDIQEANAILAKAQKLLDGGQPAQAAALFRKMKNHPLASIRKRALVGLSLCASAQGDAAGTAEFMRQAQSIAVDKN